jgi:anti-sigma regulatory factor (Ser/Thr protein kinase)
LESKEQVGEVFRAQLDELPEGLAEALLLAIDELVANAIEHGCGLDPCRTFDVSLIRTDRIIIIYVRDDGPGFPVGNVVHSALSNPPENPLLHTETRNQLGLRPGGFGIMLAKQIADELLYNENGNAVLLIKYLENRDSTLKP